MVQVPTHFTMLLSHPLTNIMPYFPALLDYNILAKHSPLVPHTFSRTCSASLAGTPHYHACMPSPLPMLCHWLPLSLELPGLPCPLQGLLQQLCICLSHMCLHLRLCVASCTCLCALARMPTLTLNVTRNSLSNFPPYQTYQMTLKAISIALWILGYLCLQQFPHTI